MRPTPAALAAALVLLAAPLGAQAPLPRLALADGPPPARFPQDPAAATYRQAREALNHEDWTRAYRLFQTLRQRWPRSRYAGDALYWEAFARYRLGGSENYRYALGALDTQRREYPNAPTRDDATELGTRIRGELAQGGDAGSAQRIAQQARTAAQCNGGDPDDQLAALNALLQMDSERAMPLLRRVLARRDACSERLRSHAVFLVSQKGGAGTEQTLLDVARNDPSSEVRGQAVFWLSQTGSERAVDAIQEVLRSSSDANVQEKAIFALSQHSSPRAAQLLRQYAERDDVPENLREKAIFWIGQRASQESADYLRSLFVRLRDPDLKEKVLFSISQMRGFGNERWILNQALDASQPVEVRKKALFWAGQSGLPLSEFASLYDRMREPDLREQIIFVLSQRTHDAGAIDKLIDIARHDPDRRMREKALFWLGQSNDPRAARAIEEIIGS